MMTTEDATDLGVLAKKASKNNPLVWALPYISVGKFDQTRVYYHARGYEHGGFNALALQWCGGYGDLMWCPATSQFEILFSMVAYYDGLRHLYMGNELSANEGYLYYLSAQEFVEIATILKDLEKKYCLEDCIGE